MINFFYDKQATYRRIWNIVTIMFRKILIIGVICFVVGAFFHPVGYIYQILEFVSIGAVLLFIGGVLLIAFFRFARPFYQQITSTYKNYAKDGLLHYSLFIRDSRYVLKCIESEMEFEFSKEDIIRIIRKKGTIILQILPDRIMDFPDREDIYSLFTDK